MTLLEQKLERLSRWIEYLMVYGSGFEKASVKEPSMDSAYNHAQNIVFAEAYSIHEWMKPFIEEFGLDPEVVRILGREGIQDDILNALQRARSNSMAKKEDDQKPGDMVKAGTSTDPRIEKGGDIYESAEAAMGELRGGGSGDSKVTKETIDDAEEEYGENI